MLSTCYLLIKKTWIHKHRVAVWKNGIFFTVVGIQLARSTFQRYCHRWVARNSVIQQLSLTFNQNWHQLKRIKPLSCDPSSNVHLPRRFYALNWNKVTVYSIKRGTHSSVVARWIAGQQVKRSILHRGMIHNKQNLISPGCSRPSIPLQCRIVA